MWFFTSRGELVNLSLASRVFLRKNKANKKYEIVAVVPGWKEILDEEVKLLPGYVPVVLFSEADGGDEIFKLMMKMMFILRDAMKRNGESVVDIDDDILDKLFEDDGKGETTK